MVALNYYKVTFQDDSPYLQHYGVLGMKWGRRKDGAPQGTVGWNRHGSSGRQRVNSVLSPRGRKIAKGIAIGAGVAALGLGAHMTGADKAVINAVRNHKPSGYISRQKGMLSASRKLGEAGVKGARQSTQRIVKQARINGPVNRRVVEMGKDGRRKVSRLMTEQAARYKTGGDVYRFGIDQKNKLKAFGNALGGLRNRPKLRV